MSRKVCNKREMWWELDGSLSRTQDQRLAGVLLDRARGECECRAKWHCVGSRLYCASTVAFRIKRTGGDYIW